MTLQHLESVAWLKDESFMYTVEEKDRLIREENLALVSYFEWNCETATERDHFVDDLAKHIR